MVSFKLLALSLVVLVLCSQAFAGPNYEGQTDRPLRYQPNGTDFVIINGIDSFNRSMYGSNTAFRVDGGDKPEFSFYLPGRGGNTRLAISSNGKSKWLTDCANIEARYRAGSMVYIITDPEISSGKIQLTAIPLYDSEGIILEVKHTGTNQDVQLITAFGGVHGSKGSRNGDIGTEKISVSEFFKFKSEYAAENVVEVADNQFKITAKAATILGKTLPASSWKVADAEKWNSIDELVNSEGSSSKNQLAIGTLPLEPNTPAYVLIERNEIKSAGLDERFKQNEAARAAIVGRLSVDTPDPYINAAVAALTIACEGTWDDKQNVIMHGAVAWRNKYLGWRGIYWPDVMGLHDRTRLHLSSWFKNQNIEPIPDKVPPADADANLARSENALHSNGDLSKNHYDMQLVAFDGMFRHLEWTGDLEYAKEIWPVLEKHLAWERRLFRREIGPDKLPLYEAYACIWASDDLWYNGGGATHATAYNYYHNQMAAKIAKLIGKDPAPYQKEADLILKGMQKYLWVQEGWYAEWKDILGLQLVHPNAGLYTYYHTIDSKAASPKEAFQMSRFVESQIPHIPIKGKNIPDENLYTLPTTNWMPEAWSTNNVVMAEVAHTSLALWQANQSDEAMRAFKGCLMDSMFTGQCPGNVGMCTQHDLLRGEAQRDFADGCGSVSRAILNGLFGIEPRLLDNEVIIKPGFPRHWKHASIRHADLDLSYASSGSKETYTLESRFKKQGNWRLQLAARGTEIQAITLDGRSIAWKSMDVVGEPRIEIIAPLSTKSVLEITWSGNQTLQQFELGRIAAGDSIDVKIPNATITDYDDPQAAIQNPVAQGNTFAGVAKDMIGHRTLFVSAKQGSLNTIIPVKYEVRPAVEVIVDQQSKSFTIRNNSKTESVNLKSVFVNNKNISADQTINPQTDSAAFEISEVTAPGTIRVGAVLANGQTVKSDAIDWSRSMKDSKLESIDLSEHFNDSVSQIFKNQYLSPRSPYCSLSVPTQGIGSWCKPQATAEIDDSGIRKLGGNINLPNGVVFKTANGEGKNILFTSRWDNFAPTATIPLGGKSSRAYFMMAGSTTPMQSRFENGRITVHYADGSNEVLILENPTTWWPIERDYKVDDYAFKIGKPLPPRINLKTVEIRMLTTESHKGKGGTIPGGAATVLDLPLNPTKELRSLELQTTANEIVIGLMGLTLVR